MYIKTIDDDHVTWTHHKIGVVNLNGTLAVKKIQNFEKFMPMWGDE